MGNQQEKGKRSSSLLKCLSPDLDHQPRPRSVVPRKAATRYDQPEICQSPRARKSKLEGPRTGVSKLQGPRTGVKISEGQRTRVKISEEPITEPSACRFSDGLTVSFGEQKFKQCLDSAPRSRKFEIELKKSSGNKASKGSTQVSSPAKDQLSDQEEQEFVVEGVALIQSGGEWLI